MNKQIGMFAIALFSVMLMTSFVFAQGLDNDLLIDEDFEEKKAFKESLRETLENSDYTAWRTLMESQLTEDRFEKMVEHYEQRSEVRDLRDELKEAREAGDEDRVEELREELREHRSELKNQRKGFFRKVRGFFGR